MQEYDHSTVDGIDLWRGGVHRRFGAVKCE